MFLIKRKHTYSDDKYFRLEEDFLEPNEVVSLFLLATEEYRSQRAMHEFEKRFEGSKAKPYETLKNIPEKYVSVMENTRFKDYFGFVETDPDIIIHDDEIGYEYKDGDDTIRNRIINDFEAFATVFGFKKHELVSLRFRKLGNYHASGLYWPETNCIYVDFRTPSSFIHEYLHMLDYEAGEISRSFAFYGIKRIYGSCLRLAIILDKGLKHRLKGKYDLDYYLSATEVFARCGEIYFSRCCGIRSALISIEERESFAYPTDEQLEELIRDFFDKFFKVDSSELKKPLSKT